MDWAAEGLLDGLEGEARAARAALLDDLLDAGVGLQELRAAVAEDRLVLLPIERALLSPPRFTLAEVAERAGVPAELVELRLRVMGVSVPEDPDVAAFGDEDVEAARRALAYVGHGIDLDDAGRVLRVMSGAMARAAEPMRRLFAESYLRAGDSEPDLATRYREMAEALMPLAAADLEYLLRHHLRDFARHDAVGLAERAAGTLPESVDVAVAFADLVGFTRLGQDVPESTLTDIAERLDVLAGERVRRPARVVKTIGDAVMLVSPDAASLVETVLDLVDAAAADDDLPPLRAGIAWGRAVSRLGDWFGTPVNLASRLTARARSESVLVTRELAEALGDAATDYALSEAGAKRIKGFEQPVPTLRLRRAGAR